MFTYKTKLPKGTKNGEKLAVSPHILIRSWQIVLGLKTKPSILTTTEAAGKLSHFTRIDE